jgi:aspartate kinase
VGVLESKLLLQGIRMAVRIMKFGGAAVATPEQFHSISDLILQQSLHGEKIVCVVSAMGNTTDQLISLAKQIHPNPPQREYDMLVTVGERISIPLLAMALARKGKEAVSFTGSQSGIITSCHHADAKIVDVRPRRILENLEKNKIVIVAGFQGVSTDGEITTLGRGGSDTTAVALGAALGGDVDFYKDVPGVFTEDPKTSQKATFLPKLKYSEAIEIVAKGAKILHSRSLVLAEKNGVTLHVRSFKDAMIGTIIGDRPLERSKPIYEI